MEVRTVTSDEREAWNQVVLASPAVTFLQSWEWGEVQAAAGAGYQRLVIDNKLVALVVWRKLPLGQSWMYVPGGPVGRTPLPSAELWGAWQQKMLEEAREAGALFVRIDPRVTNEAWVQLLTRHGWHKSDNEVQPRQTLFLDVTLSEAELLAAMHQKTRYNIRVGEKHGVAVRFSRDATDIEHFVRLAQEVTARSGFHYHPPQYYRTLLQVLGRRDMAELAVAEYQGKVIGVHMLVRFGSTVTYVHGASSHALRHVMASHVLYWESMRRAKTQGATLFDLYGVAPRNAGAHHSWSGITRMKEGFGGKRIEYIGAYDFVLKPGRHRLYRFVRRLRNR
jgi:lipid II:glycine glycyltransferase (peptidoglycan interpeptide bridge formation enzyme)